MPTDCLTALLGIAPAPTTCLPFPSEGTTNLTSSDTGLFLYNVPGLSLQCGSTLWVDRLQDAREEAGRKVRAALSMNLGAGLQPRHTWFGAISDTTYTGTNAASPTMRLVLKTHLIASAAIKLNTLQLLTAETGMESVEVTLDGEVVATAVPGGGGVVLQNVLVPCDGMDHVLEAPLPEGFRTRQNKILCGGCSERGRQLSGYLRNMKEPANGFALTGEIACTAPDLLCYAVSTPAGSTTPVDEDLRLQVGYYLQYTAALEVLYKEMADGTAGRLTGLQQDAIAELADRYEAKANEYKAYLTGSAGISRAKHPCYLCAPSGPFLYKSTSG